MRPLLLAAAILSAAFLPAPHSAAQQPPPAHTPAPHHADDPIHVPEPVMSALLLKRIDPAYPFGATAEGILTLRVLIRRDGTVEHAAALAGPEPLREAAEAAVRQWLYRPFLLNGDPVAVETVVTLDIRLPAASIEPR